MIHNIDCLDYLPSIPFNKYKLIFADPPDNLGLNYDEYKDKNPHYYEFIRSVIDWSLKATECFWISYYWQHDVEIKYILRDLLKYRYPSYKAKTFIWRYTFGQHNANDCGSGFRFLVRVARTNLKVNTEEILIESERQRLGDARANPDGRVPDDFWCFEIPRVTGNSHERRAWHPTQHPEKLMERIILMSTNEGENVLDLFGGTGTTLRVSERLKRNCDVCEISKNYCEKMNE